MLVRDQQWALGVGKEGQKARVSGRRSGWRVGRNSETRGTEEAAYANIDWAEGEWVRNEETGEQVWQPAEGGPALSVEQWTDAAVAGEADGMAEPTPEAVP